MACLTKYELNVFSYVNKKYIYNLKDYTCLNSLLTARLETFKRYQYIKLIQILQQKNISVFELIVN